jgi:hypothetical protein
MNGLAASGDPSANVGCSEGNAATGGSLAGCCVGNHASNGCSSGSSGST